jgi:hypothetical protein
LVLVYDQVFDQHALTRRRDPNGVRAHPGPGGQGEPEQPAVTVLAHQLGCLRIARDSRSQP